MGDKANSVIFDNTKIKSFVPGFHCVISMSKGLSRAARYMAEHPEDQAAGKGCDASSGRVFGKGGTEHEFFPLRLPYPGRDAI